MVEEKLGKSRQWENPVLGAGGNASYVGKCGAEQAAVKNPGLIE